MGLLRLLGIEKYLKKVKNYVDEKIANSHKDTVTSVKINGTTNTPLSGTVDLGEIVTANRLGTFSIAEDVDAVMSQDGILYALPDAVERGDVGEDDVIATANTLKTINGESLIGSGDITIKPSIDGVNMTVLKYVCNPYELDVAYDENDLPEDLKAVVWDEDRFKPVVCFTICVRDADYVYPVSVVEYNRLVSNAGNLVYDGEKFTLE